MSLLAQFHRSWTYTGMLQNFKQTRANVCAGLQVYSVTVTLRTLCGAGLVHGLPDGTEEAQLQEVEAEVERQAAALKQIKAQNRQARRPFCAWSQECQDRRSRGARFQGAATCHLCAYAWR